MAHRPSWAFEVARSKAKPTGSGVCSSGAATARGEAIRCTGAQIAAPAKRRPGQRQNLVNSASSADLPKPGLPHTLTTRGPASPPRAKCRESSTISAVRPRKCWLRGGRQLRALSKLPTAAMSCIARAALLPCNGPPSSREALPVVVSSRNVARHCGEAPPAWICGKPRMPSCLGRSKNFSASARSPDCGAQATVSCAHWNAACKGRPAAKAR
mmetsp:Transcript_46274/g.147759  ORF Transcript_46274/g.147759 Transcript_46274/m.147759 type:complete len:213 (-) Transcript_46274:1142-1780(-)